MKPFEIVSWDKVIEGLSDAYKNKKGFSLISFGDAEMIFLCVPELRQVKNLEVYLSISGLKKEDTDIKEKILNLIPENDFIFVHSLEGKDTDKRVGVAEWAEFFYVWDEFINFHKDRFNKTLNVVDKIGRRYSSITDGTLLKAIEGAKVLLIGYWSPLAEQRLKIRLFKEHYKNMNFDKINVVGSIPCPEFSDMASVSDKILEETKKYDYDVALLGVGIASTYLCPKIKQMGKIALDVGHIIQAIAGFGDKRRPYINQFDL